MTSFFFAKRWSFSLTLQALTDVHIGTGRLKFVKSDGEDRQVLEQAKDVNKLAYIPPTAFKGAARDTGCGANQDIETLFGKACIDEDDAALSRAGRLVFFGATLLNKGAAPDMPNFNSESGTYIRPQHARDRDTRTVLPEYLYHVENIPRGSTFTLEGVFFDDGPGEEDGLRDLVSPLLNRMAADGGFSVGANKTSLGKMRLTDEKVCFSCKEIIRTKEEVDGRTCFEVRTRETVCVLEVSATEAASTMVDITCTGPLLVADPARAKKAADSFPDRDEVICELRYKEEQPSGWERALRQSLRSLAGYLEATLDKNSATRIDDPFVAYTSFDVLCSTQRLFGVEGFRGLLSLHVFNAETQDRGLFPGLELDTLTQGALAHAAFVIDCPVNGALSISLSIDNARYKRLLAKSGDANKIFANDTALVDRLNQYVAAHGLQAGAKVTRGYGWFEPFKMALSLEVPENA
jgi:CRISPR/Cas system CSM-associated protein Csm3 (group 7 of RAMP superfamily)